MSLGKITTFLLALAGVAGLVFYSFQSEDLSSPDVSPSVQHSAAFEPAVSKEMFGIPTESYDLATHKIKRGQFFSDILGSHGIDQRYLHNLVVKFRDVFDEKRFKAGKPYTLFFPKGKHDQPNYFVYEINDIDYVVYDFLRDSVYAGAKEVTLEKKTAAGVIQSSLYKTFDENNLPQELGYELSDVFAWVIDFYRLQQGDKFKVIYQQKIVDGKPAGVHRVLSAVFNHAGNDFYAFYYQPEQLKAGDYFDESANSLRKEFLKSPIKFSRISSKYSKSRLHPVLKKYKPHLGVDYAAPTGTPILSVGDGIVVEAQYTRSNGNYVKVRHNSTYSTQYLHMSSFAKGVKNGAKISQGQVIGYVGSTGLATGPHVCFRFWKNGVQVDPLKVQIPPSKPVEENFRTDYYQMVSTMKTELDKMRYDWKGDETNSPGYTRN